MAWDAKGKLLSQFILYNLMVNFKKGQEKTQALLDQIKQKEELKKYVDKYFSAN